MATSSVKIHINSKKGGSSCNTEWNIAWAGCLVVFMIGVPIHVQSASLTALNYDSVQYPNAFAFGIADDGTVVGDMNRGDAAVGLRWSPAGDPLDLGTLGGSQQASVAFGVSRDAQTVVGYTSSPLGQQAFRWSPTTGMEGLGALNSRGFMSEAFAVSGDGRTVVGDSLGGGFEAFRWTAETGMQSLGDFPGGSIFSTAWGVNHDGSVVVGYGTTSDGRVAFRWTAAAGMESLGDLPGGRLNAEARAVSADGSIVTGFGANERANEAFVWTAASGMKGLGCLPPPEPGGSTNSEAYAISPDGAVIGGTSSNGGACLWRNGGPPEALKVLLAAQGVDYLALGWSALLEVRGISVLADRIRLCGLGIRGGTIFTGGKFVPFVAEIDKADAPAPKLGYVYDAAQRRMTFQVPDGFVLEEATNLRSPAFVPLDGTGQLTLPASQSARFYRLKRKP